MLLEGPQDMAPDKHGAYRQRQWPAAHMTRIAASVDVIASDQALSQRYMRSALTSMPGLPSSPSDCAPDQRLKAIAQKVVYGSAGNSAWHE